MRAHRCKLQGDTPSAVATASRPMPCAAVAASTRRPAPATPTSSAAATAGARAVLRALRNARSIWSIKLLLETHCGPLHAVWLDGAGRKSTFLRPRRAVDFAPPACSVDIIRNRSGLATTEPLLLITYLHKKAMCDVWRSTHPGIEIKSYLTLEPPFARGSLAHRFHTLRDRLTKNGFSETQ